MAKSRPNVEKVLICDIVSLSMVSEPIFVPEHNNENWLTDLVCRATHLNELNLNLQSETRFLGVIAYNKNSIPNRTEAMAKSEKKTAFTHWLTTVQKKGEWMPCFAFDRGM